MAIANARLAFSQLGLNALFEFSVGHVIGQEKAATSVGSPRWPVFLPDGKHFIFFQFSPDSQAIGGDMTKGRLGDRYTGDFTIVQAGRRIELNFKDGKVAGKKSNGVD